MIVNKKSKVGFSYLLALGVVSFSRYAWLPWILQYMHQRKYNSWPSTVSSYGLVLSCFYTGQYLGHIVTKFKKLHSSWFTVSFMTLTGSFIALCYITRITFVLFLFGLMGFSGTILSGVSINIDSNTPQMTFLKRAGEIDINDNINHNLACFAFVIIIAGYLYDSRPLAQFPMYSLAVLLAIFCLLVMVYFVLISRTISARTKQSGHYGIAANKSTDVAQSREGKSLDVSKAIVAEYTGPVPLNFLSCCGRNIAKARAMYGKALQWRKEQHVDDILITPQSHFHDILVYYPHAIHGYSLDGCAVVYEILGKGDMAGLKRTGASIDNIAWHFALRNELVFQKLLDPEFVKRNGGTLPPPAVPNSDPNVLPGTVGRMMTVLDVGGISFSAVNADVLSFIQKSGYLIDNYYPEQVSRLVICNAPSWFSTLWRMISSVLPPSIQKKVDILYDSKSLDKYIHPSQRPVAYGGTDVDLGHAPGHLEFLALEVKWREILDKIPTPATTTSVASDTMPENSKAQTQPVRSNDLVSSSTGASKGVLGWFRTARPAYLGEGLSLRYNKSTGTWDDVADMEEEASHEGKPSSVSRTVPPSKIAVATKEKIPVNVSKTNSAVDARSHNTSILQQQVAELGMVLAIHAAHRANARKDGVWGSSSIDMEEGFGSTGNLRNLNFRDESLIHSENLSSVSDEQRRLLDITNVDNRGGLLPEGSVGRSRIDRERNLSGIKLSPTLFLLVVTGYIFCLWIQIVLFTLIPVWMVIPASAGGMEYSVRETALVLSSAAIFALMGHKILGRRCEQIVKSSPVRSLRIGCGLLLFVLFLLPFFMEYTTRVEEATMPGTKPRIAVYDPVGGSADGDVSYVNVFGRTLPSHVPVSYSTYASADHHNVAYDYVHWASSKYTFHHRSILALQMPALLLAVMLCGLQLCRRASGVLLQLTLSAAFHAPSSVRRTLNGFVEIGGPTLAACLYSLLYGMGLKFPLDSSSFFWLSGCTILLVYIGSIMLKVQFRGDYGVMPDYKDNDTYERPTTGSVGSLEGGIEINMERNGSGTLESTQPYQRAGRRTGQGMHNTINWAGSNNAVVLNPWEELFNIPLSDASLLYTPAFAAYGSKLYNLKDDFKDV